MANAEPCPASSDTQKAASPTKVTRPRVHDPVLSAHAYLAHSVKIEIVRGIERVQNLRTFPSALSEPLSQKRLLGLNVADGCPVDFLVRKYEQEHGAIPTHREPPDLLTHFRIHDVDQLVSWPVALAPRRQRPCTPDTSRIGFADQKRSRALANEARLPRRPNRNRVRFPFRKTT